MPRLRARFNQSASSAQTNPNKTKQESGCGLSTIAGTRFLRTIVAKGGERGKHCATDCLARVSGNDCSLDRIDRIAKYYASLASVYRSTMYLPQLRIKSLPKAREMGRPARARPDHDRRAYMARARRRGPSAIPSERESGSAPRPWPCADAFASGPDAGGLG